MLRRIALLFQPRLLASAAVVLALPALACGDDEANEGGTPVPTEAAPTDGATPEPDTSPMGKIAFVSDRDGNNEIYVVNADGSGLANLTDHPASDSYPAWSSDGRRLIFVSDREGDFGFFVSAADGSGVARIVANAGPSDLPDHFPSWSPDGTKIAFVSRREVNVQGLSVVNIYVMDSDGSNQIQLTDPPLHQNPVTGASAQDTFPAWSPDGRRIAFASDRPGRGDYDIYVMKEDGTDLTNLSRNPGSLGDDGALAEGGWDTYPAWSPDGSKIAFVSNRDGNWEVYVMNADGSKQTNLTNSPEEDGLLSIAWSPDGNHIVFTRSESAGATSELWVMKADGSGQTRLSDDITAAAFPAWSPVP